MAYFHFRPFTWPQERVMALALTVKISKVYLIGSGIAGLASAVYLEKDAGIPGGNIHILEKDSLFNLRCQF
jgi:myosin-crossreactive antigen